jgi:hypothetical protein
MSRSIRLLNLSHVKQVMKSIAIMQPYFFPYIGYFQLISAVDQFVVYDNIKYTKKGWISRNRFLQNDTDSVFSLQLKKDSDSLNVCQRVLADDFDRAGLLSRLTSAYRRAPYFEQTSQLIERVLRYPEQNLFLFLHNAIVQTCTHMGITTQIIASSQVAIDHQLQAQDKVLALCEALGATTYLNAIGGMELYSKHAFSDKGIALKFIKSLPNEYVQYGASFVPWLSIIDVMMFNRLTDVQQQLASGYTFVLP